MRQIQSSSTFAILRKIPYRWVRYWGLFGIWLVTTAMHIPDGYLSPITSLFFFVLMIPFWYYGLKGLRLKTNARIAPLIALLAAFSFILMLFNLPLPGGTTGHAVGGVLIAILLGPDVAVIAISIALIIQAVFFGDGGILAIGANCFNMAVVLPYVGYAVFRIVAGNHPADSRRFMVGAFLGGYIGLTAAAFLTGLEFGIQPILFHAADGAPLYAPYPLVVAIPAMVIPHMLVASLVEGLVTVLVLAYLRKTNPELASPMSSDRPADRVPRLRYLWVALAVLAFLTPVGLLAPGTAWGEWSAEQLGTMGLGAIPQGIHQLGGLWNSPARGYNLPVLQNPGFGYWLSAVVGTIVISLIVWLLVTVTTSHRPTAKNSTGRHSEKS